jgi:hypothetical protein
MADSRLVPFDPELISTAGDDPAPYMGEGFRGGQLRWTSAKVYSRPEAEINNTAAWMALVRLARAQ